MPPETRYAQNGDINLAYQSFGEGPPDLVYVSGWVTNVEVMWEEPELARFLERLASFSRVTTFDKRGIGLSDPVPLGDDYGLERRVEDLRAVMDAAGVERAVLFGHSEGGSTAVQLAVEEPQRVERLILMGAYAKRLRSDDYPWAPTAEEREAESENMERTWNDPAVVVNYYAPSRADDPAFLEWIRRWLRLSASPKAAAELNRASTPLDVTGILEQVQAPTLLLYRLNDPDVKIEEGRYIAERIPDAQMVELAGHDHFFFAGDTEPILEAIEEFVTGRRGVARRDRVVATAVFADIVGSTEKAAAVGDRSWRGLLQRHHAALRSEISRWDGRVVDTAGDGMFALFSSPSAAIGFARGLRESVDPLGIEVRCGIHTGEVEVVGDEVAGLAVHIAARICGLAAASEVLVSRTVRDLLVGSDTEFEARGAHDLKGVPDRWEIFAVA